jgi:hypothetical protein
MLAKKTTTSTSTLRRPHLEHVEHLDLFYLKYSRCSTFLHMYIMYIIVGHPRRAAGAKNEPGVALGLQLLLFRDPWLL